MSVTISQYPNWHYYYWRWRAYLAWMTTHLTPLPRSRRGLAREHLALHCRSTHHLWRNLRPNPPHHRHYRQLMCLPLLPSHCYNNPIKPESTNKSQTQSFHSGFSSLHPFPPSYWSIIDVYRYLHYRTACCPLFTLLPCWLMTTCSIVMPKGWWMMRCLMMIVHWMSIHFRYPSVSVMVSINVIHLRGGGSGSRSSGIWMQMLISMLYSIRCEWSWPGTSLDYGDGRGGRTCSVCTL